MTPASRKGFLDPSLSVPLPSPHQHHRAGQAVGTWVRPFDFSLLLLQTTVTCKPNYLDLSSASCIYLHMHFTATMSTANVIKTQKSRELSSPQTPPKGINVMIFQTPEGVSH